jgi:glycine dehydrogenase
MSRNIAFKERHIGPDSTDLTAMLETLGYDSLTDLIDAAVPDKIRLTKALALPEALSETQALAKLRRYAESNTLAKSFIGMGYYGTITPAVIQRNILENPGWYTAYTPYQAEIAQGRLEALLNFQQMVIDLTGMEIANASLLDEGTAAAEAMTLCKRSAKTDSTTFFVADDIHPQTLAVLKTRARWFGFDIVVGNPESELDAHHPFGVLLSYPGTTGGVSDLSPIISMAHEKGALVAVASDLLSLVLLTPPGEMGADVVFGSSQRFGVPMGFGGPHAAFFATRNAFKRSVPGRIIGVSKDSRGNTAYRMALQTREQHIRREKATSNICTAQALLAVIASSYAVYHGPDGLRRIADRVHRLACQLAKGLQQQGFELWHEVFFDTVTVTVDSADSVLERGYAVGVNLRKVARDAIGISLDEATTAEDITLLLRIVTGAAPDNSGDPLTILPQGLKRQSDILTHPVFSRYHSETEMLRYLKSLENKDFSLVHGMIPLGSCTMKLNATSEMTAISWPEFANIHPFAPDKQTTGYRAMIDELATWLQEITGFDAMSMQPNSGAQGEYAGLLAIRRYHESIGEGHRNICLIPSSAHGTNPASAQMMGLEVVVVTTDSDGNIDIADLKSKAERYSDSLSCLMITYPSTHGVFETQVRDICALIHEYGGQVYMDGANMNAQVGLTSPGFIGADVTHLNLHKTFCIPHGGGGPGMGPIGVKAHLAPFLPSMAEGAVASSPYGSALILTISWAYIAMMGAVGLKSATEVAILSANYLARRLEGHYPVLYKGATGLVAHECIIDIRPLKEKTGITEEDVAKRLMDYGFHAPTMSWPVAGTMMIEPTESESLRELDRFCEAMIQIREEIRQVEDGTVSAEESVVRHAPHTVRDLLDETWTRRYNRQTAVYPTDDLSRPKFWPSVNRIDNVYGDRNFVCTCPPMEAYETSAEMEIIGTV